MTIIVARVDTEHYEFIGAGTTVEEAKRSVVLAMDRHAQQAWTVEPDYVMWDGMSTEKAAEEYYGIHITDPFVPGEIGVRDGSVLS